MLERILNSPLPAIAFIIVVVYMVGVYFMHKEHEAVNRMRGRTRFTPQWNRRADGPRRRRISHRSGEFSPQWNRPKPSREAQSPTRPGSDGETQPPESSPSATE